MISYSSEKKSELLDALTALMLPIAALLISDRVGIGELIYAVKVAYVKAAIESVLSANSRVNTSRISVVTGLTRKEVSTLLEEMEGSKSARRRKTNEQRALRVLRGWRLDSRFANRNGYLADLPIRGTKGSFSQLVKLYGGDVTPISVLKELQRMKAVSIRKNGYVSVNTPWTKERSLRRLVDLSRHLTDFVHALNRDVGSATAAQCPFFRVRSSYLNSSIQTARFRRVFAKRADTLLNSVDQWLDSEHIRNPVNRETKKGRVGVGVYLIDDLNDATSKY